MSLYKYQSCVAVTESIWIGNNEKAVFRKKLHTKRTTCIQLYNITGQFPWLYILSLCTGDWTQSEQSTFWLHSKFHRCHEDQVSVRGKGTFTGRRTSLHPLSLMRKETWPCHPLPPPSIVPMTETNTCNCVSPSCARCSFLPFCVWPCDSGTRSWPASLTGLDRWRSRCAEVWRGTCWRWTLSPTPKVVCWWKLCACACCSEVGCCCFL